jgi:hypothetical protein
MGSRSYFIAATMITTRKIQAFADLVRHFSGHDRHETVIEMQKVGDGVYVPKKSQNGLTLLDELGRLADEIKERCQWPRT